MVGERYRAPYAANQNSAILRNGPDITILNTLFSPGQVRVIRTTKVVRLVRMITSQVARPSMKPVGEPDKVITHNGQGGH